MLTNRRFTRLQLYRRPLLGRAGMDTLAVMACWSTLPSLKLKQAFLLFELFPYRSIKSPTAELGRAGTA